MGRGATDYSDGDKQQTAVLPYAGDVSYKRPDVVTVNFNNTAPICQAIYVPPGPTKGGYQYAVRWQYPLPDVLKYVHAPSMITVDFSVTVDVPPGYINFASDVFMKVALDTLIDGFRPLNLSFLAGRGPRVWLRYVVTGLLKRWNGAIERDINYEINIVTPNGKYAAPGYELQIRSSVHLTLFKQNIKLKPYVRVEGLTEDGEWFVV